MNKDDFVKRIQTPYKDLWKCIVLAQQACVSQSEEFWEMYGREADRYCKAYPDNPFAYRCGRFLLDAAEDIKKMNQEGEK